MMKYFNSFSFRFIWYHSTLFRHIYFLFTAMLKLKYHFDSCWNTSSAVAYPSRSFFAFICPIILLYMEIQTNKRNVVILMLLYFYFYV